MTQGMKISAVSGQCYTAVNYYHSPVWVPAMEHALRVTEIS